MSQFSLKKAVIRIQDGTSPTPNHIDVTIGEGTLTYTESRNIEYKLNRGVIDEVREGDDVPVDVKIDAKWDFITGDTGETTLEDALKQTGGASSWASSDTDACRPYAVDLVVIYTPGCAGIKKETITLSDFRYEKLDHNAKDGTVSISGKCNITKVTAARSS